MIGVLASLIGIAAGVGFAKLLDSLFDSAGFGLPVAPIHLGALTVLLPLAVGTVGGGAGSDRARPSAPPGCRRSRPCARAQSCRRRGWPATQPPSPP